MYSRDEDALTPGYVGAVVAMIFHSAPGQMPGGVGFCDVAVRGRSPGPDTAQAEARGSTMTDPRRDSRFIIAPSGSVVCLAGDAATVPQGTV